MTSFVLIRHGQTEWNRVERFRGRADLALNETGRKQAAAIASHLDAWSPAAIFSSPLRRALETASPLSVQLDLPVQKLDGLIDIDYGGWQGLSTEEAARKDSRLHAKWLERPHEVRFPQGEGLDDVRERSLSSVQQLAVQYDGARIILVSHKVVCMVLLCALLGLDNSFFWRIRQDVAAINAFEIAGGSPTVTLVNDTCHLIRLRRMAGNS